MANIKQFFRRIPGRYNTDSEEGVQEHFETLKLDLDDEHLIRIIDERILSATTDKQKIDKINEINEKFYLGEQLIDSEGNKVNLYPHQSKVIDNRIFLSIDTIAPILATKNRTPEVMPSQESDESYELAQITRDYLGWKWNEQNMQLKMADIARFLNIYRVCALKYRFVVGSYNDYIVEVKRPDCLVIDNSSEEPGFIGEYLKDTVQGIIDRFYLNEKGEADKKKVAKLLKDLDLDDTKLGTSVKYMEFWTPKFVVWKVNNTILGKEKNPNFLYGKEDYNYFDKPEIPYILFSYNNLGRGVYGDTTSLEQAMPLQRNLNKRKRQISDNADQANGTWVMNEKYISKKEASKFTGAPNEHIMFNGDEGSSPSEAVSRIPAKDIGQQVFAEQAEDKAEIDNIFGTHSTTRGERTGQKTLGEAKMLKQGDLGRLDLMSQYIDIKLNKLYEAFLQMSLVYYDEMKTIKILGADNSKKYIDFSRDNIEDGIEIVVTSEPLLSKEEEISKYVQLFQSGLIDPLTMYEKMGLRNPKELTRRKMLLEIDPRAYLAEFAMDENSPGMEDDPLVIAKKEMQALEQGEQVPPYQQVTKDHLAEHTKFIKSEKFNQMKDDIKQNFAEHIRGEVEILKAQVQQVK